MMSKSIRTYRCIDCNKEMGPFAKKMDGYFRCAKCIASYHYENNNRSWRNIWTKAEDEILDQEYGTIPNVELAKKLNRSKNAIEVRAHFRNLTTKLVAQQKNCVDCGVELSRSAWNNPTIIRCFPCAMAIRSGENHHNWKGGISELGSTVHCLLKYVWINPILQRDGFTCQFCKKHGGDMEAHHLRSYASIRDLILKRCPELDVTKFNDRKVLALRIVEEHVLEDGVTLCVECHRNIHRSHGVNCLGSPNGNAEGNQQPSRENVLKFVPRKVQRSTLEDTQTNKSDTSAPFAKTLIAK